MRLIEVEQGSEDWLALKARHHGASEAGVMMGCHPSITRAELVRMKATCDSKEFGAWVQANLLDKGLALEATARSLAETRLGLLDLAPAVAIDDDDYLMASLDGLDLNGDVGWEHKSWNAALAALMRAGTIPDYIRWQLEHQAYVCYLDSIWLTCSDGGDRHEDLLFRPDAVRQQRLLTAWHQFDVDVEAYQAKHQPTVIPVIGTAVRALPTLAIEIIGEVRTSNIEVYRRDALAFIDRINTDLKTDQDFADAEKAAKACRTAADELQTHKRIALGQTASIDALMRTIDELTEQLNGKGLLLEKLVKARKDAIRLEILQAGRAEIAEHVRLLNMPFGTNLVPQMPDEIPQAMAHKKTVASLRAAVDAEVARVKILATEVAIRIEANATAMRAAKAEELFGDFSAVCTKDKDDFLALIESRKARKAADEAALREKIAKEQQHVTATTESVIQPPAPLAPTPSPETKSTVPDHHFVSASRACPECGAALSVSVTRSGAITIESFKEQS